MNFKFNIQAALLVGIAIFTVGTSSVLAIKDEKCRYSYVDNSGNVMMLCLQTLMKNKSIPKKNKRNDKRALKK